MGVDEEDPVDIRAATEARHESMRISHEDLMSELGLEVE